METELEVHYSELASWLRCRRQWYNRYLLWLQPLERSPALEFGTLFHRAAEAYHLGFDPKEAYLEGLEGYGADPPRDHHLIPSLIGEYAQWFESQDYKVLAVEHVLHTPILEGVVLAGTVDCLIEDADGNVWVLDLKTTGGAINFEHMPTAPQYMTYCWQLRQLGIEVAGAIEVEIRKVDPDRARVDVVGGGRIVYPTVVTDHWGRQLQSLVSEVSLFRRAHEDGDDLEDEMHRAFNPDGDACWCPYLAHCQAWLLGRDAGELYYIQQPEK